MCLHTTIIVILVRGDTHRALRNSLAKGYIIKLRNYALVRVSRTIFEKKRQTVL